MQTKWTVTLVVAGMIGIPVVFYAAGNAWTYYFGAEISGKVEAERQIESAPNRIQKYNHFYDLCSTVQSLEQSLRQQRNTLENVEGDEAERTRSNINGLVAQRSRNVNQYNADARKEYTAARFKASDLPYKLPQTFDKGDPITSCEVQE